jgi:tryptophanyl-tRNA synthetase
LNGGFGYGHAKQALYELITTKYASAREEYQFLMTNTAALNHKLIKGEERARAYAQDTLNAVREKLGY